METIEFRAGPGEKYLRLSKNALSIESAIIEGISVDAKEIGENILFLIPTTASAGRKKQLRITFKGKPKRGLIKLPHALYSSYFTCDWMYCAQNEPGDKARFDLVVYLPAGIESLASPENSSGVGGCGVNL